MQPANIFWITCIKTGGSPMTYSAPDVRSIEAKFADDVLARLSNPFHSKNPVLLGHYGTYGSAQITDAFMISEGSGATVEYRQRVDPHHPQIVQSSHPPLPSARR